MVPQSPKTFLETLVKTPSPNFLKPPNPPITPGNLGGKAPKIS